MSSSSSFSYTSYDAIGLAELVRAREISPVELLEAAYARLEEVNPQLNAVIRTYETRARQEAAMVRPGEQPFAGVPLLLKISPSLWREFSPRVHVFSATIKHSGIPISFPVCSMQASLSSDIPIRRNSV